MTNSEFNPYTFVFKKGYLNTHTGLHRKIPIIAANWSDDIDIPDQIMSYISTASNLANLTQGKFNDYVILYGWHLVGQDSNKFILSINFQTENYLNSQLYFNGYYIVRWKDYDRLIKKNDPTTMIVVFDIPNSLNDSLVLNTIDIEKDIKNKKLYQICQTIKANLIIAGVNQCILQ